MNQKIVLLSGKQGSGKTETQKRLCEMWVQKYGRAAYVVNFADIIYEMHDQVLKVLHQYWPDRGLVKDGPLLQVLGTEWGRKTIDEDVWVKCLKKKVEGCQTGLVVVADCRFENEFDAFPEALRVRLMCPEEIRKARCSMWRENTQHPSETGLDHYAFNGHFDNYLDTSRWSPDEICNIVFESLLEANFWMYQRNKASHSNL